ncbi:putative crossover junction endonuclease EME1 [Cladorrhinum sp. PSN259]|nr:putative crossover junction endonuclease EME1 [Cladorrhinum sp. PSN259]
MLPDVVTLSSSPLQPPPQHRSPSPPTKRPYSISRRSPSSSPPAIDPFLSDDDFSLAGFRKTTNNKHGPASKKQRVADKQPGISNAKSNSTDSGPSTSSWYRDGFKSNSDLSNETSFEFDLTADNIDLTAYKNKKKNSSSRDNDTIMSSAPRDKGKRPEISATRRNVEEIDPFVSSSPAIRQRVNKSQSKNAEWDPISSSAPLPAGSDFIAIDDSDSEDDFPDIGGLTTSRLNSKPPSASTSATSPAKGKDKGMAKATASNPKPTEPKKTAEERAKEKAGKVAAREAEKERRRLEKEREKEEKATERLKAAALVEVNKLRTDKKVTTPEMIVDLPAGLNPTIRFQAESLLADLEVQVNIIASPVADVVRWQRKVDSKFNPLLERYEPVPPRQEREPYAMAIVPAQQFVEMVLTKTLEGHVQSMKKHFPETFTKNGHLIYLIEGLEPYLRKQRNTRNRKFTSAVRNNLDPTSALQPGSASSSSSYISEDLIDEALLELQLMHSALIQHTNAPVETSRQIAVFTEHISTAPYRRQKEKSNDAAAGFCMETGQVKTGDDNKDTYVKMLQEVSHVTKPVAFGIANEFGSVSKLVKGFEMGGEKVLQGVRKSANKDGAYTDRMVGEILSKRVGRVFTGRDWEEEDV